jgi:hypothetical protein
MLRTPWTTRRAAAPACVAAVLAAALADVGTVAAQSAVTELKFTNGGSLKISVKIDKIGYREDVNPNDTVAVPSSKLQNIDPRDPNVLWEAFPADLGNPGQKDPNTKCDSGTIMFDTKGAATVVVRGSC